MTFTLIDPELMDETDLRMGLSAGVCQKCKRRLTRVEWKMHSCSQCLIRTQYGAVVNVEPSSHALLNKDIVLKYVWFHATTTPNWLDTVQQATNHPYVYVGSFISAMERAHIRYWQDSYLHSTITLHQLVLKPQTRVVDEIAVDSGYWYPQDVEALGGDAIRYINAYENAGSISLFINPAMLEIRSSLQIDFV